MIIQKIYNAQINIMPLTKKKDKFNCYDNRLRMLAHINADTVSFQGRGVKIIADDIKSAMARKEARFLRDARLLSEAKMAPDKTAPTKKNLSGEERKWGVSKSTAQQIREKVLNPQVQISNFMQRIFGDLKVSDIEPKNLILAIKDRAKSVISIMEKSSTREWNSIKEVLDNMTDLNGAKLVFNYKTGKEDVEKALDRLIPLIKTKQVTLHEIELQRPESIKKLGKKEQEEYDYVSKAFLDKLADAQEEVINGNETNVDKIQLVARPLPRYTKGNYCALHLILQTSDKGSRPFELQIMGARMDKGKIFDDKRFKYFDGKELDKKYDELIRLWEPLKADENKAAKEEFLRYIKDVNLQLREDEIHENKTQKLINRVTGFFKSIRGYNLTPEYDLNEQYKLMEKCDKKKIAPARKKSKDNQIVKKKETTEVMPPKDLLHKLLEKFSPKNPKTSGSKIKY